MEHNLCVLLYGLRFPLTSGFGLLALRRNEAALAIAAHEQLRPLRSDGEEEEAETAGRWPGPSARLRRMVHARLERVHGVLGWHARCHRVALIEPRSRHASMPPLPLPAWLLHGACFGSAAPHTARERRALGTGGPARLRNDSPRGAAATSAAASASLDAGIGQLRRQLHAALVVNWPFSAACVCVQRSGVDCAVHILDPAMLRAAGTAELLRTAETLGTERSEESASAVCEEWRRANECAALLLCGTHDVGTAEAAGAVEACLAFGEWAHTALIETQETVELGLCTSILRVCDLRARSHAPEAVDAVAHAAHALVALLAGRTPLSAQEGLLVLQIECLRAVVLAEAGGSAEALDVLSVCHAMLPRLEAQFECAEVGGAASGGGSGVRALRMARAAVSFNRAVLHSAGGVDLPSLRHAHTEARKLPPAHPLARAIAEAHRVACELVASEDRPARVDGFSRTLVLEAGYADPCLAVSPPTGSGWRAEDARSDDCTDDLALSPHSAKSAGGHGPASAHALLPGTRQAVTDSLGFIDAYLDTLDTRDTMVADRRRAFAEARYYRKLTGKPPEWSAEWPV
jgi:hypothetical protein